MTVIEPTTPELTIHPDHDGSAEVIVIGAGHNGLVAACYLARAGRDVLVIEANPEIGGCTTTAPYIAAAPEHLISPCAADFAFIRASTVIEDLDLRSYGYREQEIDPPYVALHPDGSSLAMWRDPASTAREIRRFSPRDADAYERYAHTLDIAMEIVLPLFVNHPVRPARNAVISALRTAGRHPREMAWLARMIAMPAADAIERSFTHPLVRDLLCGCFAFVTPITQRGSGIDFMFPGFVHRLGIGRPIGGTGMLPAALARCLAAHSGRIRTAAPVRQLTVRNGTVTGVELQNGERIAAPVVLASCDPTTTLTRLLPASALPQRLARRARRIPTDNSGVAHFKVDMALSGRLSLSRHQALRSDDVDLRLPSIVTGGLPAMRRALTQSQAGQLPDVLPTTSLIPSAMDPSQAPDGHDTLYAWSGWMPGHPPEGWDALAPRAAEATIDALSHYYDNIRELEIGRLVESPLDIARRTHVTGGQVWHVDLTLGRMGPLRPALGFGGYRTPIPGLYLTGGGTHPGPGVSGIPGQLAAQTILHATLEGRAAGLRRSGERCGPRRGTGARGASRLAPPVSSSRQG
jgi:phytoene dehydrogenase-like protein